MNDERREAKPDLTGLSISQVKRSAQKKTGVNRDATVGWIHALTYSAGR
ncbi:hypothetical protein [Nitratireductor luteus]|nr:hypothetical protein [Nitratireductor luteus]